MYYVLHTMKYKFSILNVTVGLFLLWIIFYSIFNNKQLSEGEGWGMIGMVGRFVFGVVLLVVDAILQATIKDRFTVNVLGVIAVIVSLYFLLFK